MKREKFTFYFNYYLHVLQLKSRRDDEQKIKFVKTEFGVTTIVYFRKLRKNQKR